jgi:hypothetical protein
MFRKILCAILMFAATSCYSVSTISKEDFEENKNEYNLFGLETLGSNYSLEKDNISFTILPKGIAVKTKTIGSRTIPISEIQEFIKADDKLLGVKTKNSEAIFASDSLSFDITMSGLIVKTTTTNSIVIPFEKIRTYESENFSYLKSAFAFIGILSVFLLIIGYSFASSFSVGG